MVYLQLRIVQSWTGLLWVGSLHMIFLTAAFYLDTLEIVTIPEDCHLAHELQKEYYLLKFMN